MIAVAEVSDDVILDVTIIRVIFDFELCTNSYSFVYMLHVVFATCSTL